MPQNLKSRAPDRPNVDFGIDFGTLLASFFHYFFDFLIKCANHQNAFIHSSSVAWAHSKSSFFPSNFDQIFIHFLMPHSGTHFLSFWCDLGPKRSILGAPWRPAGPQMAPKITQVVPKSHPSGAKKGPESIIPRIVLRHWKRAMINEKMI